MLGGGCATTTKETVTIAAAGAATAAAANERLRLGLVGVGGRGNALLGWALGISKSDETCEMVAVCDVWQRRMKQAAEKANCEGTLNWREVVDRDDIDAVLIATPDHWHATIAIEAMKKGKDVYCEKPMAHTIPEAKEMAEVSQRLKRVTQVGSQTTSQDQWWQARKAIADGMIGKLLMSQGSYHRNSTRGEWNYRIREGSPDKTGDDYIDWDMWLGPAQKRPWSPDRYYRFRKYWDYSGGTATDLFFHVMAPLNLCWGEAQFPLRVSGTGGNYVFKDEREVPDTFMLCADYRSPREHSLVLSSSMANNTHIPGLIRGHEGTIVMVPHGQFEGNTPHITVSAQRAYRRKFVEKWGEEEIILETEDREDHMRNFLRCVRTRERTVLPFDLGFRVQVPITLSVMSYRTGRTMYFDQERHVVSEDPILT